MIIDHAARRILFLTGLTGYGIGGTHTEDVRLVRGIAARGYDVALASDVLPEALAGVRHFHVDYPLGDRVAAQIEHAIEEFQPDLCHVTGGGVRYLTCCEQELRGGRWVFTAHNVPPAERMFGHLHGHDLLHYAARNLLSLPSVWTWSRFLRTAGFQRVICHSQTVGRRLLACGCPPERVREIPFGCELPENARSAEIAGAPSPFPADAWPKITTIAGLAHHKGQLDAVRLAARLLPDFPKLSLILIGMMRDKSYRAFLEKTIIRLGLSRHVSLLHSAPEATKYAALRDADLYVQPSHEEGFCIAYLEAAMLTPRLLGCDTGAIAAVSHGDATARVVKPGDVEAMTRAARELLAIRDVAGAVERRSSALVRRYSWDAYLDRHVEVYEELLGHHPSAARTTNDTKSNTVERLSGVL